MIGILDIGGNYGSLLVAFEKIGVAAEIGGMQPKHSAYVLPGVGRADVAMAKIDEYGWTDHIRFTEKPILGICCGFHVMCRHSEEGDVDCLGILPWDVKKLPQARFGWEETCCGWQYFCHLYAPVDEEGMAHHVKIENFTGVQFHPEKSGTAGLEFLRKWANEKSD